MPRIEYFDADVPGLTLRKRLSATVNDALIVMLLPAQRSGEVCRMRWEDVDLDSHSWTTAIPRPPSLNVRDRRGVWLGPSWLPSRMRRRGGARIFHPGEGSDGRGSDVGCR
jgi:integrase